ncbi:MAG: YaaC family protein [Chthoniobacterales bacterium]
MQSAAWQSLYCLESRDVVFDWHKQIYNRELNARRAKEITSSAKQAREFFRNSAQSNDSVRPLLSFYGVASLSRSLSLLLKQGSGEEALNRGHGLEASGWTNVLSGEISEGIGALGTLRIKTTSGLFADFLRETDNRMCIHVDSSAVDWRLSYGLPPSGNEIALEDLLSRIPDLQGEYSRSGRAAVYAQLQEMTYSSAAGFKAKVRAEQFESFKDSYTDDFTVTRAGDFYEIKREEALTEQCAPQFMHTYVNKMFGSIPTLHIVKPMASGARYSQLAVTYMTSYILGMLARYFPTHWMSLLSGEKGDALGPAINAAQRYIDSAFPEMVVEFIHDTLDQAVGVSQTPGPVLSVV